MPGGGGGSGRRVVGGTARLTYFDWLEASVGPQRSVTPGEGQEVRELTPLQHVQHCLRIPEAIDRGDKRPTLVYFHWPHDETPNGRLSDELCDKTLNEETVARWGTLFRCVQVDMATSDARLTTLLEAGARPSFVAVDQEAKVVARIPALGSASKMARALKEALQKYPEAWRRVQEEVARQEEWMNEARARLKAGEDADALALIDKVRFSQVRVGPLFDKAQSDGMALAQKLEREKADARAR